MSRVLVIGGGVAGVEAAVAAREQGAEVTLLYRAPGASALYAGAVEMAGDVEAILMQEPYHPFTRVYRDHLKLASDLAAVLAAFAGRLGRAGLRFELRPGRYLDIHGGSRQAAAVPATVAAGELDGLRGRQVGVVAIEEVADYDAEAVAIALSESGGARAAAVSAMVTDLPAGAVLTDLFGRPAPKPRTPRELLAYPPGFRDLPENGFELLASPPAPHGWRLQQALLRTLATAGVAVEQAEVTGFERRDDRLAAATGDSLRWEADAFVLASGRFIGGGLVKTRLVREPLLDLAVYYQGERIEEAYPRVRHLEYLEPEPAFRTGLLTDKELRPLQSDGQPAFANLYAAGSVLGGYDYAGGCGFGVPLLTGRLAGRLAAG